MVAVSTQSLQHMRTASYGRVSPIIPCFVECFVITLAPICPRQECGKSSSYTGTFGTQVLEGCENLLEFSSDEHNETT